MKPTNTIILLLIILILMYFINECKKVKESFTDVPSISEKIEDSLNELEKTEEQVKEHENLYGKLYTKVGKNKYQPLSKYNIDDSKYINPYIHGLFDRKEKVYIDQVKKNKELTSNYANQYCQNLKGAKSQEEEIEENRISESELEKIEERIFSKNFDRMHHQYHHNKHIKHSHDSSNHKNGESNGGVNDSANGGNGGGNSNDNYSNDLLTKYNLLTRKSY